MQTPNNSPTQLATSPEIPVSGGVHGAEKLQQMIALLSNLTPADQALIERAYETADKWHTGQVRASGQPYIMHPLSVATTLAEMDMDAATICAALLHDAVEDTPYTIQGLEKDFTREVAQLVYGVTKMSAITDKVKDKTEEELSKDKRKSKSEREAEFLKHIFIAMGNDVRVILIKLADRLDNMRTLRYLKPESQIRNARETMDIFAPMANRLGIGHFKWQLEDLAFRYLHPEDYHDIANSLDQRRIEREDNIVNITSIMEQLLDDANIVGDVKGRPKHIYSIYRKMKRKELPFDQIFDVRAVRILVEDVPSCYQILGIVHGKWKPVHGEFDDYIAAPKQNGYQSLHTAVYGDDGRPLEIQIRTFDMDRDAEYGIAAHWKYKESGHTKRWLDERVHYLRQLLQRVGDDAEDAQEFVEDVRESITDERVYVMSPKNDIYDMPLGATPIDFAYHVHTEVGHRCRGAKVNGRMVSLDYKLQNGDRVEIITANRGGPSLDWMQASLGYVYTQRARSKIKHWFRRRDRDNNIHAGREALDREIRRMGIDETYTREQIAEMTNYANVDHMLEMIGLGNTSAANLVNRIIQLDNQRNEIVDIEDFVEAVTQNQPQPRRASGDVGVRIDGGSGMLVNLANCCSPAPGDPIVGFITRGSGVRVHHRDCTNILNTNEPERLLAASWYNGDERRTYVVDVEIRAHDREGLMRDIGAVIAAEDVSMTDVQIYTRNYQAVFDLKMKVCDAEHLSRVLTKLEAVPEVIRARRKML